MQQKDTCQKEVTLKECVFVATATDQYELQFGKYLNNKSVLPLLLAEALEAEDQQGILSVTATLESAI